jgi:hypothetical protein
MRRLPLWWGALAGCLLGACDDGTLRAFEPRLALGGTGGVSSDGQSGAAPAGTGGDGPRPTLPLIIDDFEDGDFVAENPLGWWYRINDKTSTQGFGIEPVNSGTASVYALRTHGSGFTDWGALIGVDLTRQAMPLNVASYRQLCFAARVEPGSSTVIQAHLLQGGQHYIEELSVSEDWSRYCRAFGVFKGPSGAALVPSGLMALQFFFLPSSPFAFWLDDVEVTP